MNKQAFFNALWLVGLFVFVLAMLGLAVDGAVS